ncbi:MAG TPA: RluA family pseudouridine synthase [Clostridiales bacterium]|jgi:23S rRNA pseudouridine1911/1915/1917 synthase|nr:RluA family pseudouridine synthase [Clostridiales bacterium]
MRTLHFTVPKSDDGKKVLHFLKKSAGLSTKLIRRLKVEENGILLNGKPTRTVDLLSAGDLLTLHLPEDKEMVSYEGFDPDSLDILYEDEDIIVINKPAGMAMHPSHNHQGDTLANLLAAYLAKQGKTCSFRAVGRLDKGTSGIVVCALHSFAASRLQGNIRKTYYAIPAGKYEGSGTIREPIFRPDPMKTLRTTDPRGVPAVTHWKALRTGEEASLLEIHLETGRTHQIRVHFASLGTPLIGDRLYGIPRDDISHQALHCGKAEFIHPYTGEKLCLEAPLPVDFSALLQEGEGEVFFPENSLKSPDVVEARKDIPK